MKNRQGQERDVLTLAREEVWSNPERSIAFALIDIAQSLRKAQPVGVLTDSNVPIPTEYGLPEPPDDNLVSESDIAPEQRVP